MGDQLRADVPDRATEPDRDAPLGYGDGWSRAAVEPGGGPGPGVRVPLVGNVSMDAVMADVTDVPGTTRDRR